MKLNLKMMLLFSAMMLAAVAILSLYFPLTPHS